MQWKLLCLSLVLSLSSCQVPPFQEICVKDAYPPSSKYSDAVKTYVVDLDLPNYNQRWASLVKDKGPQIRQLLQAFKTLLLNISTKAEGIIKTLDENGPAIVNALPQPFADEMRGIATVTGLQLGEIALFNVFYEVFTVCTSIVAQDPQGKLYHARNLDFGLFMGWDVKTNTWLITEFLRKMVVNVDYQRGGKTVFKAVHFAGYIGVLSAVKPGVFTLTMNERFNVDGGYIGILEWVLGMRTGRWMGFLTRQVMENATSYEEAKAKLSNTEMLAPAYFILGGTKAGQGCVITRSREKAEDVWEMSQTEDKWYILETNYDHTKQPFILDDRRTPAHRCMRNMTQTSVSFKGLYNVLSSKPVLNKLTAYTALMQVDGSLETYLRYCSDPCWPW